MKGKLLTSNTKLILWLPWAEQMVKGKIIHLTISTTIWTLQFWKWDTVSILQRNKDRNILLKMLSIMHGISTSSSSAGSKIPVLKIWSLQVRVHLNCVCCRPSGQYTRTNKDLSYSGSPVHTADSATGGLTAWVTTVSSLKRTFCKANDMHG